MINRDNFSNICIIADEVGRAAVEKVMTRSVLIYEETQPFSGVMDNNKPTYILDDFPCGFAWVNIYPQHKGNTRLGKEERSVLEANGFSKNEYEKSYQLWISAFNQSMQKKQAYAGSYAKVLRDHGIKAYSGSRMD
jgi:hypothetical protein